MIRRSLAAAAAATLVATMAQPVWAARTDSPTFTEAQAVPAASLDKGPVVMLGEKSGPELYIVQLADAPAPTRSGSLAKSSEKSYVAELKSEQAELRSDIGAITKSTPKVVYTYTQAINGIAVELTRDQALEVSQLEGVTSVQVDFKRQMQTDVGPEWIGAPGIWSGDDVPSGVGNKGEGIIVGVLDSGINAANPSFADSVSEAAGGDGYDHTNPFGTGNYVGVCNPANASFIPNWGCNDKLLGFWDYDTVGAPDGTNYDDDGHGTHTASTSAGNQVDVTTYAAEGDPEFEFSADENIKGVAPHANLIAYDVCDGGCSIAAITAGINQAILDDVDVINYSIGSPDPSAPWDDADAIGFLSARAAGIYVATSAGNDGPGAATVGSPADVPWITSVGATQHNRQWQAAVQNISATGGATLPDIAGVAFASETDGAFPLVTGLSIGSSTCERDPLAGQDLTGKIVVCDRGGTAGRVEKGTILAELGAEGMILANDPGNGTSLNADPHDLPAVHITNAAGVTLKAFMAANPGTQASLSGGTRHVGEDVADIMAGFSSHGPNRAVSMISPSISAPGVDILAGNGKNNEISWGFISGTSMASPHTAGSYALIKSAHPEWTPAEAQSALMTTAKTDIRDNDLSPADWFDMGSGRIDLTQVTKAGLVQDVTAEEYEDADPAVGGDVRDLNTASMADNECLTTCSWTRSFTATDTGAGTWTAAVQSSSDELSLSVDKTSFTVAADGGVDLTVTADVDGAPTTDYLFGTLVLTPPTGSEAPVAHLPIAVLPASGVLPEIIDITTRRDAGSQESGEIKAGTIENLKISAAGLIPEEQTPLSVPFDNTNLNVWDGNGVQVVNIDVPAGATRFTARIDDATSPDFDMYVGTGAVAEENVVCQSASGGSAEECEVAQPDAGTYWVLIQNWEADPVGTVETGTLSTAVVVTGEDAGNLRGEGPTGPIAAAEPFTVRAFFDEADLDPGETWQGSLTLGTKAGSPDDIGIVPVTVRRVDDDVVKTADVSTAAPGDVITYTVDVASNVTPEDLTYTITDTLPDGTTYVPGSATGGATVAGNTLTWSEVMPTAVGAEGKYTITTSAADDECVNPLTGDASYLDLFEATGGVLKTNSAVVGNGVAFTTSSALPFGFLGNQYPGLTFTDDGYLVYGAAANYGGTGAAQSLPDPAKSNNVAAALWQDMEFHYDLAANEGVTLATNGPTQRIIEFDNMRLAGDPTGAQGTTDIEIIAESGSSDLVVAYDNVDGPISNVTIGTENATGTKASTLVNAGNATGVITDDTVVCYAYAPADLEPKSFTYQVTVDADVHKRQVLTNNAVHTTSDPGAKPETASVDVTIPEAAERSETALSLDPNPVVTGGTTTAMATVFSAGESEATGTVEFLIAGTVAGTGTLDATGKATASLTAPAAEGVYQVTARYLGDAANLPSTSAPANLAVTKPVTPPTPGPSPTPTPTPTPTPSPVVKVKTKIVLKTPKKVEVGSGRGKVTFVVTGKDLTPSGAVEVTIKGAGKDKTVTVLLDEAGKGKVKLPKFKKAGKVKVTVEYLGDVASLPSSEVKRFRVFD